MDVEALKSHASDAECFAVLNLSELYHVANSRRLLAGQNLAADEVKKPQRLFMAPHIKPTAVFQSHSHNPYNAEKMIRVGVRYENVVNILNAQAGGGIFDAAGRMAANGRRTLAECYLLGIDPEDPDDDFRIMRFWMDGNVPMFEFSHTTDGSGNSFLQYVHPLGKVELSDHWQHVSEEGNPSFRFFTVDVVPPGGESIVKNPGGVQL